MLSGNVLITGGAGTLGHAIVAEAVAQKWPCTFTIYSRDVYKHMEMKRQYPACHYVLGDVRTEHLYEVMVGHDIVIHAAAQKHIPDAERQPGEAHSINVLGSQNVLRAAAAAGVKDVVMISTDKACHPVNTYGATKLLMERISQEFALRHAGETKIHLLRYGNVMASNGSVMQLWNSQVKHGDPVTITDPAITRFWLTERDAIGLILKSIPLPSGAILVPKLKSCSMGELAAALYPNHAQAIIGARLGDKMVEELVTQEEQPYAVEGKDHFVLYPISQLPFHGPREAYDSFNCERFSADEIRKMAGV